MYSIKDEKSKKAHTKLLTKYTELGYNICDDLAADLIGKIGSKSKEGFDIDCASLSEKLERWEKGQKLAKLTLEAKNTPYESSSNVKYPITTTAAIQFNSRAMPGIIQGDQVAKPKVIGQNQEQKQPTADNACKYMNWQLLFEMDEWSEDTDQLTLMLSLYGTMFRKTWFSPSKQRPCTKILKPEHLITNIYTQSLESSQRISEIYELYPNEIISRIRSGIFRDFNYAQESADDEDAPIEFIEQHCWLDLDEDGYKEPYIATIEKSTGSLCRLTANYRLDDIFINSKGQVAKITKREYYTRYLFIPSTDGSFYGQGFFDILYPINDSINTTLNQIFDAGKLQNMSGNTGFIAKNLRLKRGQQHGGGYSEMRLKLGEFMDVNATGDDIRRGLVPLTFQGPSPVLFNLLGFMVDAGREVANIKDVLTGENTSMNQPVGTTLALIEQGMQMFGSIFERIHRAIGKELRILKEINAEYLNPETYAKVMDQPVGPQDFKDDEMDYIPVSDPRVVTDVQKMGRANFLSQFLNDPLFNPMAVRTRLLSAAKIDNIEELLMPPSEEPSFEERLSMMEQMNKQKEIELEMAKIQIKAMEARSKDMVNRSTAIKNIAEADSKQAGNDLDMLKAELDALDRDRQHEQRERQLDDQRRVSGVEAPSNQ